METHDIGQRRYWQVAYHVKRLHWPYIKDQTVEIDTPYRIGVARVFSVPGFKFALILGRWTEERFETEDDAIRSALSMKTLHEAGELDPACVFLPNEPTAHDIIMSWKDQQ